MVKIEATVERCGHNRRVVCARMVEAEPHVMRFVGDNGAEFYGPFVSELLDKLIYLGHAFQVSIVYRDVPIAEFVRGCEEVEVS